MFRYGCGACRLSFQTSRGFDRHNQSMHPDWGHVPAENSIQRLLRRFLGEPDDPGVSDPPPDWWKTREERLVEAWLKAEGYTVTWNQMGPVVTKEEKT